MDKPIITAIPVCCNRIAYHFAWCTHVLLVKTIGDIVLKRHEQPMAFVDEWDLARALVALKIDQLVCIAMPDYIRGWLESKGVHVVDCQKDTPQDQFERFKHQVSETECAGCSKRTGRCGPLEEPNQHRNPKERK